jgi:hypothetical protein
MSLDSPPKTVSLDSEDTSRQETGKQFHLTFTFDILLMFLFIFSCEFSEDRDSLATCYSTCSATTSIAINSFR